MTKLMEEMVAKASELPADQQDAVARQVLAELVDDAEWDEQFARTTPAQWSKMAERVRQQVRAGKSTPFDPDKL